MRAEDGRSWRADRIVIAVGCRAARLPVPGGELALTYHDIWTLKALPHQVTVIGGADTGCQIASIFADLGADVRLIEAGPRLVPGADASVSAALGQAFEAKGIKVITGAKVQALERSGEQVSIQFTRGGPAEHATADAVFAAVGWPANLHNLDLDAAGVTSSPRAIPVDDYLQTNVGHIFAAGDVNGRSKLVQSARLEGRIAAWNAVHGPTRQPGHDVVPSGSFTDPEYGTVGMTEDQAAGDHDIAVGIARYDDLVRPVADGHPDGFCKLIADQHSHAHSRRPRARRILSRNRPGRRDRDARRHERRAARRDAIRLPDLHRGRQHGRPESLPQHRHRQIPGRLELPRPPGMSRHLT